LGVSRAGWGNQGENGSRGAKWCKNWVEGAKYREKRVRRKKKYKIGRKCREGLEVRGIKFKHFLME